MSWDNISKALANLSAKMYENSLKIVQIGYGLEQSRLGPMSPYGSVWGCRGMYGGMYSGMTGSLLGRGGYSDNIYNSLYSPYSTGTGATSYNGMTDSLFGDYSYTQYSQHQNFTDYLQNQYANIDNYWQSSTAYLREENT